MHSSSNTHSWRWLLIALLTLSVPVMAQLPIEGQLTFSTDGGKTFTPNAPTISTPQAIHVRAEWRGVKDTRRIEGDVVTTALLSEEGDFASANQGKQTENGKVVWSQRIPNYYANARRDGERIYILDLRARANSSPDPKTSQGRAQSAVPARTAGVHRFVFRVRYAVLNEEGKNVSSVERNFPFDITIDPRFSGSILTAGSVLEASKNEPASPQNKVLPPSLPRLEGARIYVASKWQLVEGSGPLTASSPCVRPTAGQEISIRADVAGDFFVRVLVETGSGHGEEELAREEPWIFLNGRPLLFARATPPVSWNGTNLAIIETAERVRLAAGDELRWNSAKRAEKWVGGVAAATQKLTLAPTDVARFYDPDMHDAYRLDGTFGNSPNNKENFLLNVHNVAGRASKLNVNLEIRDFWQNVVAQEKVVLDLQNRAHTQRRLEWSPRDTDRYRAIVHVVSDAGIKREKVFDVLQNNPRGARPRLWLNADWEWTSLADDGSPQTRIIGALENARELSGWSKVELPASWADNNPGHHIAWYRRSFVVPEWLRNKRLKLHFSRISFEGHIYVNGQRVGQHYGHSGPFEFDITDAVQNGTNELYLGVRNGIAALEPSELTAPNISITPRSRFRAPEPLKEGVGEVWIDGVGTSAIKDAFIQTSFRTGEIKVQIEVPTLSNGGTVTNRVFYQGKEVLRLPDTNLPANSISPVEVKQLWKNPILWNPGDPKLLQLVTELNDSTGQRLDRLDTRFGFREFWPEGRQLMWNGKPMKFAAAPFLSHWGWSLTHRSKRSAMRDILLLSKRMGVTMQRHIYDPEGRAELNDEEGIVMAQGMGGVVNATGQKLASDEIWKNAAAFARENVRGLRNHPSIVTWYLSNEFHAASEAENRARLIALGESVRELDPTRILEFGCDLDLNGYSSIISTHYPVDVRALAEERSLFPEAFYWRRFGEPLQVGQKAPAGFERRVANVPGESRITWGHKPIIINETLWNFFFLPPDGLSRLMGEEVYRSPTAVEAAFKTANAGFIRGHRDAEASVITPWEWAHRDPMRNIPEIDINPLQRYSHFYSGQKVHFDINLHHDRLQPSTLDWVWSVDGSKPGTPTQRRLNVAPAELNRQRVEITLPKVTQQQQFQLNLRLLQGTQTLGQIRLPLNVYPQHPLKVPSNVKFGLFDPSGSTRKVLTEVGGLQTVARIDEGSLLGLNVLIIGENANSSINESVRPHLDAFLRRGGRILVLAQNQSPSFLPFSVVTTLLASNKVWSFHGAHPVMRGLKEEDLANWFPHGQLGSHFYLKPEVGDFRTILESGGPNGLVYSGLLERPWGDGLVVCSQLDLSANLGKNPVASQLWRNLLDYLAQTPTKRARVGFWGDSASTLFQVIQPLAPRLVPLETAASLSGLDAVLIDGQKALPSTLIDSLRVFARRGGKVWVHGVTPENQAGIEALIGAPMQLRASGPPAWRGRAVKTAFSPNIAGVTHYDLFWKKRTDSQFFERTFYDAQSVLAPLGDWAIETDQGKALLYPQLLVEVPAGQGTIVLDNLNWHNQEYAVRSQSQRLASTLLTNLGVVLEGGRSIDVPANLEYQTVDITTVANRAFADEVADDGQGGWTDQGSNADLSSFPKESLQTFHGVPFAVSPRGAVVLSSPHRKPGLPQSVELPVSGKADVLFFLQTSAWTNKRHHASYIVNYEDGTQHEVQLVGDVNLRDWVSPNYADSFPFETETRTRAAWTGPTKTFPSATLFLMAWPNPHPNRSIKSITFQGKNAGIPVLVGVTKGIKKSTISAPSLTQNDVKALMAQVYEQEQKRNWRGAVNLLETILQANPGNLEALFRLGKNYEELGLWQDAENTYQRSLALDRNQPEILRAIETLARKRKEVAK